MDWQVDLELGWRIGRGDAQHAVEPLLFDLLEAVRDGGHLKHAARATGVSYRHAWGLVRTWEERLGEALVLLQRGRGASLTRAGRALVEARAGVSGQMAGRLHDAGQWAGARLASAFERDRMQLRIVSSHSERIAALARALTDAGCRVSIDVVGSEGALRQYDRGDADAAGFHVPLGVLGRSLGRLLFGLLDPRRDRLHRLERRRLGLMYRADAGCDSLTALVRDKLRFVNRQSGSATRLVLDGLLGLGGIAPGEIVGYGTEEHTHTAVAAVVAAGAADVGFGTATAAAAMRLGFTPLVDEIFYLVSRRELDDDVTSLIGRLCAGEVAADGSAPNTEATLSALRRLHGADV